MKIFNFIVLFMIISQLLSISFEDSFIPKNIKFDKFLNTDPFTEFPMKERKLSFWEFDLDTEDRE